MLIVHHDEEAFEKIEKEKGRQLLAESVELTHHLHASGQHVHASPLQPAQRPSWCGWGKAHRS